MTDMKDELQKAVAMSRALLGDRPGRSARVQRLDYLDRELQRTHTTMQIKITNRENVYEDEKFLKDLRAKLFESLDDLTSAEPIQIQRQNKVEIPL